MDPLHPIVPDKPTIPSVSRALQLRRVQREKQQAPDRDRRGSRRRAPGADEEAGSDGPGNAGAGGLDDSTDDGSSHVDVIA